MAHETTQPGLLIAFPAKRSTMRLLIIEDDRDAADYLVKAFREVGHIADRATDGEEGLALALDLIHELLRQEQCPLQCLVGRSHVEGRPRRRAGGGGGHGGGGGRR